MLGSCCFALHVAFSRTTPKTIDIEIDLMITPQTHNPLPVNDNADAPAAIPHTYSTNEDTTLTIPAPGLLQGATDPDGAPPGTAELWTDVLHGTLMSFNADGSFTYVPDPTTMARTASRTRPRTRPTDTLLPPPSPSTSVRFLFAGFEPNARGEGSVFKRLVAGRLLSLLFWYAIYY